MAAQLGRGEVGSLKSDMGMRLSKQRTVETRYRGGILCTVHKLFNCSLSRYVRLVQGKKKAWVRFEVFSVAVHSEGGSEDTESTK